MSIRVVFICMTCQDRNKQLLGTEGFQPLQTNFDSLTEAMAHTLPNLMHHIEVEVITED